MPILLQQGPWVSSAPGVIEAIEILESAEQTEDKPLTEREAKLFHCKEVRNQSQMFGCRPPSALSALPVVSRPLLWLCHHVHRPQFAFHHLCDCSDDRERMQDGRLEGVRLSDIHE
jgi:hypothetical protein